MGEALASGVHWLHGYIPRCMPRIFSDIYLLYTTILKQHKSVYDIIIRSERNTQEKDNGDDDDDDTIYFRDLRSFEIRFDFES